jgi:cell division protein FtsZ
MAGMGYSVMGTAVRSGPERAKEAAQAAMASPLLESGAIDGARGILINITGSSGLKLTEVFEASTIIQNAAHEDANIIFGAVQDETMGDDVKITVIATGFREELPQRRERMLAAAALQAARVEAPPPRIVSRPVAAPFASEIAASAEMEHPVEVQPEAPAARKPLREKSRQAAPPEPVAAPVPAPVAATKAPVAAAPIAAAAAAPAPAARAERVAAKEAAHAEPLRVTPPAEPKNERVRGAYVPAAAPEPKPELIAVPASVFDDDFFRRPNGDSRPASESSWEPESTDDLERVAAIQPKETATHWPEAKVPSFAGYAAESSSENDELDIPAFLRRSR